VRGVIEQKESLQLWHINCFTTINRENLEARPEVEGISAQMTARAILFDFWQTLFNDSKERDIFGERVAMIRKFLSECRHDGSADVEGAFERIKLRFWEIYHGEQRTPVVSERLGWVMEEIGVTLSNAEMEELAFEFGSMGIRLDPAPTENIKEVLESLSGRFALGIVSDTGFTPGRVLRQLLERNDLLRYFSAFSFSDETGHAKPHRRQFENALEQMGIASTCRITMFVAQVNSA
jgi:putative hydrolase of the HAD superfamily